MRNPSWPARYYRKVFFKHKHKIKPLPSVVVLSKSDKYYSIVQLIILISSAEWSLYSVDFTMMYEFRYNCNITGKLMEKKIIVVYLELGRENDEICPVGKA